MKTMAVEKVGSTILVYHSKEKPSDDEWDVFVEAIRSARPGMNTIVVADGGGPNAPQRKRMVQAFNSLGEHIPAAVLFDGLLLRGLLTAFKWLGVNIKPFRPNELNEAMDYLGLPPASQDQIRKALSRLKSSVLSG